MDRLSIRAVAIYELKPYILEAAANKISWLSGKNKLSWLWEPLLQSVCFMRAWTFQISI
jgi:hypothetical protein